MSFHDPWIEWAYGSPPLQLLASVAVVVVLVVLVRAVRRLRPILGERYTKNAAEAVEMTVLAGAVVLAAYLLADIWAIPFVFGQVLEVVAIDRWVGIRSAISVAVLLSGYMLIRVVNRSFDRLAKAGAITDHQKEVAYHVVDAGILFVAGLAVLSVWGISLTNVIIGAGVLSAVLALAAQKTVAAIIAGFVLLLSRPFRAGDWVEVAGSGNSGASGIVQDVTISHTKIRTFNDEHVLVPNDEVTAHQLTNYSRSDRLRIDVDVNVDYETDLDRARRIVREAIEDLEIVSETRGPKVVVDRFDESAIVLQLQFWIDEPNRRRAWDARTAAISAIKAAFDREDVTIPFPQRTHEFRHGTGLSVERGDQRRVEAGREAEDD